MGWQQFSSKNEDYSCSSQHCNRGHFGIQGAYVRVKKHFVWRGLKVDVSNYVKKCDICQHAKHEQSHPTSLLQPLLIPEGA
jgi:hypothetical protein